MMKANQVLLFGGVILIAVAGVGLAQDESPQRVQAKPAQSPAVRAPAARTKAAATSDFPVIGYLERRDRTITIKAGPKGPLYSVKTSAGKVLFENLTAAQLQAKAPELHDFIKTAMAGKTSKGGVVIDAGLGHDARR